MLYWIYCIPSESADRTTAVHSEPTLLENPRLEAPRPLSLCLPAYTRTSHAQQRENRTGAGVPVLCESEKKV